MHSFSHSLCFVNGEVEKTCT